jgi:CDP-6-deoxy-D-xylo-4-hexulose-3-dehydrase|tara:strand:+ start:541 stop:1893 length:1353 start_codon:yes stop_codon:yes gene_type:complete
LSDLNQKKEQILSLVSEYINEKGNKSWERGSDWVEYSGPNFSDSEYLAAIGNLLEGWFIFGKKGREFEIEFPQHLGMKHGALTNSGSSANLLMVAAAASRNLYDLPKGSKFITPVVCFPTTINPIIQHGFEPVFVDVELPSVNLDLDKVEEKLKEDPDIKGIIFAHVLGNPPDMDRLMGLVKKYDLIFLEDACDALGSYYDGRKLGSYGHMSTCSFFPAHHMTLGEGGFIATNSNKARTVLASVRDWGRGCYCNSMKPGSVTGGTACGNRFKNWLPGMPEAIYDHRYVFNEIGYNLKPLELQAAMGLEQIKKLPEMDAARRKNHSRLNDIFKKYEEFFHLPEATPKSDPCWFAYLLTLKTDLFSRDDFVQHLEKAKIQTRSYFSGNILAHPGYHHLAKEGEIETFPVANKVTMDSFFLGTFIGLTDEKLDYIEEVVDDFFEKFYATFPNY